MPLFFVMIKKICKTCNKEEYLFSHGNCKRCATALYNKKAQEKPKTKYTIVKQTDKNKVKRSEKRVGYGDFFAKHINIILSEHRSCQECGARLQGLTGEVAHILSKSKSPEVAKNDLNVLYLCFYGNSCHNQFDNSLSMRATMDVFPLAVERYKLFKNELINYNKEAEQLESQL